MSRRLVFADLWRNPANFPALGFGSGLAPKAPGTVGTLAAVPIYYYLLQPLALEVYLAICLAGFLIGIWLCGAAARSLGEHDHGGIVWDEFVGLWIACIALPPGWVWLVAAFLLFRLFDIWKPFPIHQLDRKVHGGIGIMIDDVIAGVFALTIIQAAARLL